MKYFLTAMVFLMAFGSMVNAQHMFETDTVKTTKGDLNITFIGHGTLMFTFNGMVIHVDPWSRVADYTKLPDADIILLTHNHTDHLDPEALKEIGTDKTTLIYTRECAETYPGGEIMRNGMSRTVKGVKIEAVPAYCLIPRTDPRSKPHTKGECNGYILTFGDKRVYVVSETENIPELKAVKNIDIAFVAMDGIFNMTPEEAVDAVKAFKPSVVYPYHYADADLSPFVKAFEKDPGIEVRIRDMKIK